jgi:hypothetical protein
MRRAAPLLAGLLLVFACGTGAGPSGPSKDAVAIANALRSLDDAGSKFSLTQSITLTGGDIPMGRAQILSSTATGAVRGGVLGLTYRLKESQGTVPYNMIVARGLLFARPAGDGAWKAAPAEGLMVFLPSVRLDLLRETALLSTSVSSSISIQNSLTRKYVVTPAATQLKELQGEGVGVDAASEQAFLKTAKAEIDVFLALRGGNLTRMEVHMSAVDPSNGETQTVDSTATFSGGKVDPIAVPLTAQSVPASQILSP